MSTSWGSGPSAGGSLPPELDPRNGGGRRGRRSAGATAGLGLPRLAVRTISALLSAGLIVYIGLLWSAVHGIDDNATHVPVAAFNEPHNTTDPNKPNYDYDGEDRNLLIVGNDDRAGMSAAEIKLLKTGGNEGSLSTDTMMIVHIPKDGSKATLISLPRDSYVAIPGHGMDKLNTAYAYGYRDKSGTRNQKIGAGADLLIRTIYQLTALHVDNFVQVGLVGFYRIAKAVGGIPINLCDTVDDTVAHNRANNDDGGSGFKMTKGKHTLNPVQALEFVRQRHNFPNGLGDLDRVKRQRYFLTAAFRQVASANTLLDLGRLKDLVQAIDKSLYIGGDLKILDLAKQLSNLSADNIVGDTIPFEHFADIDNVGSVNIVDPVRVKKFVRDLIEGAGQTSSAYAKAKLVDPGTVHVTVLNAGTENGAAAKSSGVLGRAGFASTFSTDQPAAQAKTTIQYPKGMESQAKTLKRYVPGAQVTQADVSTVTLTLGSDGLVAKPTPAATPKPRKHPAIDAHCIA